MKSIPIKSFDLIGMIYFSIKQFKFPNDLIKSYLSKKNPERGMFLLRNGKRIFLSNNEHDGITVMVIFCRREYGSLNDGDIVLDIGANIGAFSLFAAFNGAKKVYAFEPSPNAFKTLCKNIKENDMQDIIFPFNLAVSGLDKNIIYLSEESSPYNTISKTSNIHQSVEVETISLDTISKRVIKEKIDFCKIDCEGAEYEILYNAKKDTFKKISKIRMENHKKSEKGNLIDFLHKNNYELIHDHNLILWFEK